MAPFKLAAAAAALYGNANLSTFGNVGNGESLIQVPILPQAKPEMKEGFYLFQEGIPCLDPFCNFLFQKHFHCSQPRCYYATDRDDVLLFHSKKFHYNIDIPEGYACFDQSVDCRLSNCSFNKKKCHFHCIRVGCNYSFDCHSEISIHETKHQKKENELLYCKNKQDNHLNSTNSNFSQASKFNIKYFQKCFRF